MSTLAAGPTVTGFYLAYGGVRRDTCQLRLYAAVLIVVIM